MLGHDYCDDASKKPCLFFYSCIFGPLELSPVETFFKCTYSMYFWMRPFSFVQLSQPWAGSLYLHLVSIWSGREHQSALVTARSAKSRWKPGRQLNIHNVNALPTLQGNVVIIADIFFSILSLSFCLSSSIFPFFFYLIPRFKICFGHILFHRLKWTVLYVRVGKAFISGVVGQRRLEGLISVKHEEL